MPVETPSLFSKVIQEHLELKRRNAELDREMPLARYMVDDPFSNHPLFKSEEQARLEETMDGVNVAEISSLAIANDDTAEHTVLALDRDLAASLGDAAETRIIKPSVASQPLPVAPPAGDEQSWGQSRDFDWGDD